MTLEKIDFMLSPCGDTAIQDGKLVRITGADLIRQLWLIRVRTFKGEWILDAERGVPFIQEVFEKNVSKTRLEEIFRDVTLGTPGVTAVESVLIGDIDAVTRAIDLTVEAIIEGGESLVFHYDGTLGIGACSLPGVEDFPKLIEGMTVWFDGQDLAFIEYAPPNLSLENKAATGSASSTNVVLEGVSSIGLKRGLLFVASSSTYMDFVDTPAIRFGDGDLTVVAVMKHEKIGSLSGKQYYGIIALDGYDVGSAENEFYNFEYVVDYDNPDKSAVRLIQGKVGEDPDAITLSGQTVSPTFIYEGNDADNPDWLAYRGNDATIQGASPDPLFKQPAYGNGLRDFAVKGEKGNYYLTSGIALGNDDFVITGILNTIDYDGGTEILAGERLSGTGFDVLLVSSSIAVYLTDDLAVTKLLQVIPIEADQTYKFVALFSRSGSGNASFYLNKINVKTISISSMTGSLDASGDLALLAASNGGSPTSSSIIRLALYQKNNWLASDIQDVFAEEEFDKWCNLHPQLAAGTPSPTNVTVEKTRVEQLVGSVTHLHSISEEVAPVGRPIVGFDAYRLAPEIINLFFFSNDFAHAGGGSWTKVSNNIDTSDTVRTPDYAVYYQGFAALAAETQHGVLRNITTTAAVHCVSVIAKKGSLDFFRIQNTTVGSSCYFDINNGTVETESGTVINGIIPMGDDHYLFWSSMLCTAAGNTFHLYSAEADLDNTFTGDGSTVQTWVAFAQAELGLNPSPRVLTASTSLGPRTRAADEVIYKLDDGNIVQGQGTVKFELLMPFNAAPSTNAFLLMSDGTTNNKITVFITFNGKLIVEVRSGGIIQSSTVGSAVVDQNIVHKIRVSYEDGDLKVWVDDVLDITAAPPTIPVVLTEVSITSNVVMWFRDLRFYDNPEASNLLFRGLTGDSGVSNLSASTEALAPIDVTDEGSHIIVGELTPQDNDKVFFKGYSESSEAEALTPITKRFMNGDGVIGASLDNIAHANRVNFANGNINELMVYDRKLTDEERESLVTFLKGKWSIS